MSKLEKALLKEYYDFPTKPSGEKRKFNSEEFKKKAKKVYKIFLKEGRYQEATSTASR